MIVSRKSMVMGGYLVTFVLSRMYIFLGERCKQKGGDIRSGTALQVRVSKTPSWLLDGVLESMLLALNQRRSVLSREHLLTIAIANIFDGLC